MKEPKVFQSTRPRGARLDDYTAYTIYFYMFQSTRPRGARLVERFILMRRQGFNPRARGGRDVWRRDASDIEVCFNPRARGGRDLRQCLWRRIVNEFQSTRPRGARRKRKRQKYIMRLFQSTRPRGARRMELQLLRINDCQFQSTRPRGARHSASQNIIPTSSFNPRARGGRDNLCILRGITVVRFNPRARGGRDVVGRHKDDLRGGFQSTRPRGARLGETTSDLAWLKVSIHAPAGGATSLPAS